MLICLKLNNLVDIRGKRLGKKIKRQGCTIGNDKLRARILLVNASNRVTRKQKSNVYVHPINFF